jgi:AbrB family looped-hinge helix DNA binding protein
MQEFESRVGQKGQITLPAELRHRLGIKPKDTVRIIPVEGGVKVVPRTSKMARPFGSVKPLQTPEDYTKVRREFEELVAEDALTRGQP